MKKLLSILLSILMAFSAFAVMPFSAGATDYGSTKPNPNELTTGDTFEMGKYPQTRETDDAIISALRRIDCTMKSYGYVCDTNAETHYYNSVSMSYADIDYNGETYRKVYISSYRPTGTTCSSSSSYSNQGKNGYTYGTYYFKWEPIVWQVLANESDGVYVMSKMLLDSQPFNNFDEGIEWESSFLRTWLNEGFYSAAFSDYDKRKIVSVTHANESNPYDSSVSGGNDTTDNIWLLSYNDTFNGNYGFDTDPAAEDVARQAAGTDYAKCQGLYVGGIGSSFWRLRTPYSSERMCETQVYGFTYDNYCSITSAESGIRPVFKLSKSPVKYNVTFNSNGGTGTIAPVQVYEGEEYTLPSNTFKKEGRSSYGWKVGNEYKSKVGDKITVTADTVVTAVYAQTKTVNLRKDNSTTDVEGTLTLKDTKTGESFDFTYCVMNDSSFSAPSNPAVEAAIAEAREGMLEYAKEKAGKHTVRIVKDELSDPYITDTVTTTTPKFVLPFDPSLTDEYPSIDQNGDLFVYTFLEGELSHYWRYDLTLEAEFSSEESEPTPAPVLTPEEAAMPTEEKTEELIKKTNTDKKDVAGSTYAPLMLKATSKKKTATITWKAQKGATGYIIYAAPCGSKFKRVKTIKNAKTAKYTFKKLKKGKYYKYMVVAYKKTAAGNRIMCKSKTVHIATPGGKKGNPTGVKAPKSAKVKKGKKLKLKASMLSKGKVATHIAKLRFESSNKKIVTVDSKGYIKGVKKGTAKIYVITQNGICKTVKITVK